MAKKGGSSMESIGAWSFIIGALIALVLAVIPSTMGQPWVIGLLLVLGVIVGLLNISDREVIAFLVASVAFLVSAPFLSGALLGFSALSWLPNILNHVALFVVPAAVIVSIKAILALAINR